MPSLVEIILQANIRWRWEGIINSLEIIIKTFEKRVRISIWWYRLAYVLRLRLIQQLSWKKLRLITIIRFVGGGWRGVSIAASAVEGREKTIS